MNIITLISPIGTVSVYKIETTSVMLICKSSRGLLYLFKLFAIIVIIMLTAIICYIIIHKNYLMQIMK